MYQTDYLTKILLGLLVAGVWGVLLEPLIYPAQKVSAQEKSEAQIIKARGLIIVDEDGRERIFVGSAPNPKEGERKDRLMGITVNDPNGYERIGIGLMNSGDAMIGLDAPPGTGDDRNRERLHLTAESDGSAMLRFLDKKTTVAGWMRLGEDNKLNLEFLDVQPENNKVTTRRINLDGERKFEEPFK